MHFGSKDAARAAASSSAFFSSSGVGVPETIGMLAIHRPILAAIVAGDADVAQRRMARHVTAARGVAFMQTDAAAIPIGARMSSQGSGGTERARARGKRSIGRKGTK